MSYRSAVIGDVLVIRWDATPDLAGAAGVLKLVADAHRAAGKKVALLVLVSPASGAPGTAVRKAFSDNLKTMMEHARCVVMVLEGEGIAHSIKLSVVTSIQMVSRQRNLYVRASLDDALIRKPPADLGVDGQALLKELQKRDLASPKS